MERQNSEGPQRRVHHNQENNPRRFKPQFILDRKLASDMLAQKKIFEHQIDGRKIYFPYENLNKPQENFLKAMFAALESETNKNLLIESPTGTGKTLSLLVGALSWAEQHYQTSEDGGIFDNQTKIIYTSRAHSQLSQISKQLQKTPYRPRMLLFGSRQKMCINEQLLSQLSQGPQRGYNNWSHKCNVAIRMQQSYENNKTYYQGEIQRNSKVVSDLRQKRTLTNDQKELLKQSQQFLKDSKIRCTHYHDYQSGIDAAFWKEINREVLNNEKMKQMAKSRQPQTVCPYFYPKRVKNRGTLYLMPYNYILDSKIVAYSTGFLSKAIIIFDEGHNVPQTACDGYSVTFKASMLESGLRNITQKLNDNDFDADENQMENLIRFSQNQTNQFEDDQEMDELLKQIKRKNRQKQKANLQIKEGPKLRDHVNFLLPILKNLFKNFDNYFKYERIQDFKRADSSFMQSFEGSSSSERRSYNWQAVRFIFTPERSKIEETIEEMFFSEKFQAFDYKPLKEKLTSMIDSLKFVIKYFLGKDKKCFKIINLANIFERLFSILYDVTHFDKFFLEVTQFRKFDQRLGYNIFKGEFQIRCLSPSFSFKQLQAINPRSIIITSGTLTPLNVFASEIGLNFVQKQVGPVITGENILVRKVTRNLNGDPLKIDSQFYCGRHGLETQNLNNIFNLLIKTLENIPHGVLVIVSSFSCLKYLKNFYELPSSRELRRKLQQVKPHVYFQPKNNLEVTMERFNVNSQIGKGALLFCVCRAKLSQGIDFKDKLCRSVIFFGIPYVNKGDPFVVQKGRYLKKMQYHYASEWKFIEASKAINQGLGRTVRHANDYGSILLFDDRYQNTNRDSIPVVKNISGWIQTNWKENSDVNVLQKQLSEFYQKCQKKFPLREENENERENGQTNLGDYFRNRW